MGEACGVTASSAGPLIGKASSDMKAKNGVGVVHFTKNYKGAQKFEADIGGLWGTLDRKAYPTRCTCARARSSTRPTTSSPRRRRRRLASRLLMYGFIALDQQCVTARVWRAQGFYNRP